MRRLLSIRGLLLATLLVAPVPCSFAQTAAPLVEGTISSEPRGSKIEYLLVGIVVDGVEVGFGELIVADQTYLAPLIQLAESIDSSYNTSDAGLTFYTPGGEAQLDQADLVKMDGQIYIPLDALNQALFLEARFDAASYALTLSLPWRRPGPNPLAPTASIEPDFRPPLASLSQIRLDSRYQDTQHGASALSHELRGTGALAGGAWYLDLVQTDEQDPVAEDYYWLKSGTHQQWLVGRQQVTLSPVSRSQEITGAQWLYSSSELQANTRRVPTADDFARNLGRTNRDIYGTGQPGARARLLIDGRLVTSELIRLDGTYEFRDIELGSRGYREVIVEITDRSTGSVLARQNFSQNFSTLSFSQGQYVVAAGLGSLGNRLDPNDPGNGESWYLQQRYGVTDRLTLEAALQRTAGVDDRLIGATLALGDHYLVNLSSLWRQGEQDWQLDLDRFGTDWQLTLNSRRLSIDNQSESHNLRYRRRHSPGLIWGLTGRYLDALDQSTRFLKPGASFRPTEGLWVNLWPNSQGRYQTDIHYRASNNLRFDAAYEMESLRFEAEYYGAADLEYYLAFNKDPGLANLYESGVYWQTPNVSRTGAVRLAALSDTRGDWGYYLNWERDLFPGSLFELLLSQRPARHADLRSEWQFTAQLTLDFGYNGHRLVPRSGSYSNLSRGSIGGDIQVEGADGCTIDRVSILVNGYPRIVESEGCSYLVENLPPGLHQVQLDAETLPLELAPDDRSYWAEVAMSAVTRVDFAVAPEFGASGQITDASGQPVAAAPIEVYRLPDQQLLYRARSDQFGYYRADQLRPGDYLIRATLPTDANRIGELHLRISDDYRFDQDIRIAEFPAPCAVESDWPPGVVLLCGFRPEIGEAR